MSYIPIWYVIEALKTEGMNAAWHGRTLTWQKSGAMSVPASHYVGNDVAAVRVNGSSGTVPRMIHRPYQGARVTSYLPLPYVATLLTELGLQQDWSGSTLTITQ